MSSKRYDWMVGLILFSCPIICKNIVHINKKKPKKTKRQLKEEGRALIYAARDGNLDLCKNLLDRGVNPNRISNDYNDDESYGSYGFLPLHMASQFGHLAVVRCLVEHGADLDQCDLDLCTPLFFAAGGGHLPVVQYLLEQGADKDKSTVYGTSPIYIATLDGHFSVVQCLVDHGADVNRTVEETWGTRTPLHIAAREGHLEIAVYLMQHGLANLNAKTSNDELPIDMARTEIMRQAIREEEIRRNDNHGFKRCPIPEIAKEDIDDDEDDDDDVSSESSEDEDE